MSVSIRKKSSIYLKISFSYASVAQMFESLSFVYFEPLDTFVLVFKSVELSYYFIYNIAVGNHSAICEAVSALVSDACCVDSWSLISCP
jgi:hypothetical protein